MVKITPVSMVAIAAHGGNEMEGSDVLGVDESGSVWRLTFGVPIGASDNKSRQYWERLKTEFWTEQE